MEKAKARVAACRLEHQGPTSYEVGMEKATESTGRRL